MKGMKSTLLYVLLGAVLTVAFGLSGCSSDSNRPTVGSQPPGGTPPGTPPGSVVNPNDLDGDGIPNAEDAFPEDATRFASFAPAPALQPLATGAVNSPLAISDGGQIVGNSETAPGSVLAAAMWTVDAAGVTTGAASPLAPPAGAPAAAFSSAYGNNTGGQAVGEAETAAGGFVAVFWDSAAATAVELPLLGGQGSWSAAFDINNFGTVVGEAENSAFTPRAVVWEPLTAGGFGAPVELPAFGPNTFSSARATSDDGLVVGEAQDAAGKLHAVLWRPAAGGGFEMIDLGIAGEAASSATAIEAFGLVAGESQLAGGEIHAMLWAIDGTAVTRSDLGPAGPNSTINGAGETNRFVGSVGSGAAEATAIWDSRSVTAANFDPVLDTLGKAFAINALGQVVGIQGGTGFVATPN